MNIRYTLIVACLILLTSCKEDFEVWKSANENFLTSTTQNSSEWKQMSNGLKYIDITNGLGAVPKHNSLVKINYEMELLDGTPCTTLDTIGYVYNYPIGVQMALKQMHRESIWRLCIPSDLAYGRSGTRNTYGNYIIPPYTTLYIKRLELIEVINY